jgi:hypothetical protein
MNTNLHRSRRAASTLVRLAGALALGAVAAPAAAAAAETITLLFAGSSSSYWNDLPREVARLVTGRVASHPGAIVLPAMVGRSGSDIRVYAEPGFSRYEYGVKHGHSFLEKIRDERPALVVLQTVARFIMGQEDLTKTSRTHAEAVTAYGAAIRAAGGEPVYYEMGWKREEVDDEGRRRILALAQENRVRLFAPCATAWARVHRERPALALQHPQDNSHPGDAGHFLNLACFYAALVQESPLGRLPRTYPVWPHDNRKPETAEAKAAEAARLAAFTPDAYQATLPKWMHRHMSLRLTATLDDATARYLEAIAWETWRTIAPQLGVTVPSSR